MFGKIEFKNIKLDLKDDFIKKSEFRSIKAVILPIHPEYNRLIFDTQEKTNEFRRSIWKDKDVEYVIVYETAPTSKIIGYFKIKNIIEDSPKFLWDIAQNDDNCGLNEREFFKYYGEKKTGFAISIINPLKLMFPIGLSALGIKRAPQFFQYITVTEKNGRIYSMGVCA